MGDDFVSDVRIEILPEAQTILVVTWTQTEVADETWLEFSFEDGSPMKSRRKPGKRGDHRDVVLGVPGQTDVTVRIVSSLNGKAHSTREYLGTTGSVPSGMPIPEVLSHDPVRASPDRYLFGSVEDSEGGCADPSCYYRATFWLYIMDRRGRIVWYYADPASNPTSSFQRIARDGEYIWVEKRSMNGSVSRSVVRMTLDRQYFEEIAIPVEDCIDVTDDGSLLYDSEGVLRERDTKGRDRAIWNCKEHFPEDHCYTNTVNWNPLTDTVLLSFPTLSVVVEIDRKQGMLLGQYGDGSASWAFSPPTWRFEFQHFANITPQGTLLVSSHMPGFDDTEKAAAGGHAFMEFQIDRKRRTLVEKWVYNDGPEWAMFKGMAVRLPNGNTLANYGTGGVIREITADKETVFHVKFDVASGNDFFNKMVGHNVLLDDLYALNGGPR